MKRIIATILLLLTVAPYVAVGTDAQTAHFTSASSQYASISDASAPNLSITGAITVEFKFRNTTLKDYDIIGKWTASGGQRSYLFTVACASVNQIQAAFDQTGAGSTQASSNHTYTCDTGVWHYAAVSFNGTNSIKTYLDGTLVSSATTGSVTAIFNSSAEFDISSRNAGTGDYMNGDISEVAIWNVERTEAQIASDKCGLVGNESNLVAYYQFEGNLNDTTSNAYNLTDHNTITFTSDVPTFCVAAASKTDDSGWWEIL